LGSLSTLQNEIRESLKQRLALSTPSTQFLSDPDKSDFDQASHHLSEPPKE
jgi:hypothetical protein